MIEFIKSLISEDHAMSSVRFCLLFCFIISNTVIIVIWGCLSVYHGVLQTIPESVITLYCLANGISLTGKVVQKNIEVKKKMFLGGI